MAVTKDQVLEFLKNMSVIELADFVKELEEVFGVSAAAPVAVAAVPAAGAAAPEAAEKTPVGRGDPSGSRRGNGCTPFKNIEEGICHQRPGYFLYQRTVGFDISDENVRNGGI